MAWMEKGQMQEQYQGMRDNEKGNVLFLILIAVALFAALSYAVTQSTRTSGGSSESETTLIDSAQVTQYPASVRTAVVRMIIGGVDYKNLEFNLPANFGDCTGSPTTFTFCVFHPSGGGATYAESPKSVMASGAPGPWYFNAEFEVEGIGTTAAGSDGNEVIAFLPGITETVCKRLNKELGISGAIQLNADLSADYVKLMDNNYDIGAAANNIIGTATGATGLVGKPFGCFQNSGNNQFVYYHVLLEQ